MLRPSPILLPQRKGNITFRRRNTENLIMPEIEMHKIPRTQAGARDGRVGEVFETGFQPIFCNENYRTKYVPCMHPNRRGGRRGRGRCGRREVKRAALHRRRRRDLRVGGIFRRKNKSLSHDTNGTHCMPAFPPQHTILARPEGDHVRSRGCVNSSKSSINLSGT